MTDEDTPQVIDEAEMVLKSVINTLRFISVEALEQHVLASEQSMSDYENHAWFQDPTSHRNYLQVDKPFYDAQLNIAKSLLEARRGMVELENTHAKSLNFYSTRTAKDKDDE